MSRDFVQGDFVPGIMSGDFVQGDFVLIPAPATYFISTATRLPWPPEQNLINSFVLTCIEFIFTKRLLQLGDTSIIPLS